MYKVATYQDYVQQLQEELTLFYSKPAFKCDTATETEMLDRCRELGKSAEYARFCVMAFVEKRRRKDIASAMYLAESTVKEYKRLRRRELEN